MKRCFALVVSVVMTISLLPVMAGLLPAGLALGAQGNTPFVALAATANADYQINYVLNGGANNPANPSGYSKGNAAISLKSPTRDGYTFAGWYSNATLKTKVTSIAKNSTGDKTFYAKWTPVSYKISYNLNGGSNAKGNPATYTVQSANIRLLAPSRTGYSFAGWYRDAALTQKIESIPTGSFGALSLYAAWDAIPYSISYVMNGGTNNPANPDSYTIASLSITLKTPSYNGYTFAGWFSNPTFKTKLASIAKGSTGDKILYAKWTPTTYKISYNLNGGVNAKGNPATYSILSSDIQLLAPSRTGYVFAGWYSDAALTQKIESIPSGSFGALSLYAAWNPGSYSISYVLNGGTNHPANPDSYTIASPSISLKNPSYDGYTFAGWYSNATFKTKLAAIAKGSTGDKTLYAKWTLNTYKITYNLNGGANAKGNPATYTVQSADIQLLAPSRTGFSFAGWYTDAALTQKIDTIPSGSFGALNLYAAWDAESFHIDYELNGGVNNPGNPSTYKLSSSAISLLAPTRDGYAFAGWYSDPAFKTKVSSIAKGSSGDKTLYAKWSLPSYVISYVLNGGTNNAANPSRYTVESPSIDLLAPSRTGYTFEGWFIDKDFQTPISSIQSGSMGNISLYASWSIIDFSISYQLNGGSIDVANPVSYTVEDSFPLAAPSKDYYDFAGWYSDEAMSTRISQISKGSTGDLVLRAKWSPTSYRINYVLNGGSNASTNPSSYTVESAAISFAAPSRAGYDFLAWYGDKDFSQEVSSIPSGSHGEMSLYAGWSPVSYSISYELNGGSIDVANPDSYTVEDSFSFAAPSKNGYVFAGWYTDEAFSQKLEGIAKGSTGELKLYAKWELPSYAITYVLDGGSNAGSNPESYNVESSVIFADPSRAGYDFDGWFSDPELSQKLERILPGSSGDISLYAAWSIIEYSIGYNLNGGYDESGNPDSYTVESDDFGFAAPSKDAFEFAGWYADEALTQPVSQIAKGSTGDLSLYAKWTLISYPINYVLNGGSNAGSNPSSYNAESSFSFDDPVRVGYDFDAWFIDEEMSQSISEITEGSSGELTLYAKWDIVQYSISYELNGGSIELANPDTYTVESTPLMLSAPSKDCYDFDGWYTDDALSQKLSFIPKGSIGDLSLQAKWLPVSYAITYVLDGGINASSNPASYNVESSFDLADPSRSGYEFAAWYTDAELSQKIDSVDVGSSGDLILYAKWNSAPERPIVPVDKVHYHGACFDTLFVNGAFAPCMQGKAGAADGKLDAVGRVLNSEDASAKSLLFRGWAGFEEDIQAVGYQIDDCEPVYSSSFVVAAEAAVKYNENGGAKAIRYAVNLDVSALQGVHTIAVVLKVNGETVRLDDTIPSLSNQPGPNTEIIFRGPGSTVVEPDEPDTPDEPVVIEHSLKNSYIDYVDTNFSCICSGSDCKSYLANNAIRVNSGVESVLKFRGWALLDCQIAGFGYRIDGGNLVTGSFLQQRPDAKALIEQKAEGFLISADVSKLSAGKHELEIFAIAPDASAVSLQRVSLNVLGDSGTDAGAYGITVLNEEIVIPALSGEYKLLQITDAHMSAYTSDEYQAASQTRRSELSSRRALVKSGSLLPQDYLPLFYRYADSNGVDAALLSGDIADFPSVGNVNLLKTVIASAKTPSLYVLGNHDWTYTENYQSASSRSSYAPLYSSISNGDTSFQIKDMGEFLIVAIDNSDDQFTEAQYVKFQQAKNLGKPIVLMLHVPFYVNTLSQYNISTWGRDIALGGSALNASNSYVAKFYNEVCLSANSPVVAVIAGHLHTSRVDTFPNGVKQILTGAAYEGICRLITVKGTTLTPAEPDEPDTPAEPDEPVVESLKLKVSADQVFASDLKTDLAKFGGNDPKNTALAQLSDTVIHAHGWAAASTSIVKYGYRYGDEVVLETAPQTAEAAVLAAGKDYMGSTGSASRFKVKIPIDPYAGEVVVVAKLSDGQIIDLWKITYPAKTVIPAGEIGLLNYSIDGLYVGSSEMSSGSATQSYIRSNTLTVPEGCGSTVSLRGWTYLNTNIRGFAYRIDGGELINGSFIETRADVKSIISQDAEGYRIQADISKLSQGDHSIAYYVIAADSQKTAVLIETVNLSITEGISRPGSDGELEEEPVAGVNYEAQVAPAEDHSVSLWFDHITQKTPQSWTASTGRSTYVISMAGNSIEDCQFFLAPDSTRSFNIGMTAFSDGKGNVLGAQILKEGYYNVGGVMIPDALPPLSGSVTVQGGNSQGFVIKVAAPMNCPAGLYSAQLNIADANTGLIIKTATVYVQVWGFSLSEATALKTAFHADGGQNAALYNFMLQNRICLDTLPVSIYAADSYLNNPRVTTFCLNPNRSNPVGIDKVNGNALWKSKAYLYFVDEPSEYFPGTISATRTKGESYCNAGFKVVAPFFIDSEMGNGQDQVEYMDPGINIWCTKPFAFTSREYLGIPGAQTMQSAAQDAKYGDFLSRIQSKGEEIWTYVCCGPEAPYCNWMIQNDGTETIVSIWQLRNTHSTGILYWNVNYAAVDSNLMSAPNGYPIYGDGVLVTQSNGQYISSLRLEGLRMGIQDYQMLYMIEQLCGSEAADDMAQMVSQNVVCYTNDDDYLHACRVYLGNAVDKLY